MESKNKFTQNRLEKPKGSYMNGGCTDSNDGVVKEEYHDGLPKYQLVKLILDSLKGMGYRKTAESLEKESNIQLENENIINLRNSIIRGEFNSIYNLIKPFNLKQNDHDMIKFFVGRQKYLESLENDNIIESLEIIRNELIPLNIEHEAIHKLSNLLILEREEIYKHANWDGIQGNSRDILFDDICNHLNCDDLFKHGRLQDLIKQSIKHQRSKLPRLFRNSAHINLYKNPECPSLNETWETIEILKGHESEVWGVSYSHNGEYLTTFDSSGLLIVWKTNHQNYSIYRKYIIEEGIPIVNVSWHQDNRKILVCTNQFVLVHDIEVESVYMKFNHKLCTCSAWLPGKDEFVTGGLDGHLNLVRFASQKENHTSLNGFSSEDSMEVECDIIHHWEIPKINDICIEANGRYIVAIDQNQNINIVDIESKLSKKSKSNSNPLTCSISNNLLLINESSNETPFIGKHLSQTITVYDIDEDEIAEQYSGYKQCRYFIRSTFGGRENQYIFSGSEDSLVYVWYRPSQELSCKLEGHTSVVNSVSWNNSNGTLASCSDDGTIRIWEPK